MALMLHWLVFVYVIHHLLFLITKKKLDITKDNVWYFKTFVGKNILHLLSKQLIENILESWGRNNIIKTDRRIAITRITKASVPIEYGMKVFKHCDSKSYAKYVVTFVVHFSVFLVSILVLVLIVWIFCEYDQCDYNIKSRVMQGRLISHKIKINYELSMNALFEEQLDVTKTNVLIMFHLFNHFHKVYMLVDITKLLKIV